MIQTTFLNRAVIAELGSVADGSFGNALKLIDVAADCGAQAVKIQVHIPGDETLRNAPSPPYFQGESRYDYFKRIQFDQNQLRELKRRACELGLNFGSSVFSPSSLESVLALNPDFIKIPSGEILTHPLLRQVAETVGNIPVIVSTGMSTLREIDACLEILSGCNVYLMQCTSQYPCPPEKVGINIIPQYRERYDKSCVKGIGFSDHTNGCVAAILAVGAGVSFFEKHLTFSNLMYGSDAPYASEPREFSRYCGSVAEAFEVINHPVDKDDVEYLNQMREVFSKKVVLARDVSKDSIFTDGDYIALKAPGGLAVNSVSSILGSVFRKSLKKGHVVLVEDFK